MRPSSNYVAFSKTTICLFMKITVAPVRSLSRAFVSMTVIENERKLIIYRANSDLLRKTSCQYIYLDVCVINLILLTL